MKRISLLALACLALAVAGCSSYNPLGAATPQFHPLNAFTSNQGCTGITAFGNAEMCFDSTNNMAPYTLNSSGAFVAQPLTTGALTATTATITSSADKALNVSNGGHISNPIGSGTAPTSGTGTITAGGTDSAFTCTGGTSPVTVTFGTAFAVAPSCACSDVTSATAVKAVPSTSTLIVTTTGTDSFSCVCIGH